MPKTVVIIFFEESSSIYIGHFFKTNTNNIEEVKNMEIYIEAVNKNKEMLSKIGINTFDSVLEETYLMH